MMNNDISNSSMNNILQLSSMGNNYILNSFNDSDNDCDTIIKSKIYTPTNKLERRKREALLGEITLELLKSANQELRKEMEKVMA